MLQKLRGNQGFTLIELMIVIAIIGILAAIAIPNFISYRDKSYCSATESDGNSIASAVSDYFAIPANTSISIDALTGDNATGKVYVGTTLSNANPWDLTASAGAETIFIAVTDISGRCPDDYQDAMDSDRDARAYWDGDNVYYKTMTMSGQ